MTTITQQNQANRLIFLGLLMFLLGLTVGLFIPLMANPRMGLSAHLEGVLNGVFMIALGLIWRKLVLSATWLRVTFWLTVYGTFANLLSVLIAAVTGFGKMMPIAGGREGTSGLESLISFLLLSLTLCMLAISTLALLGFYRHMKQAENQPSVSEDLVV